MLADRPLPLLRFEGEPAGQGNRHANQDGLAITAPLRPAPSTFGDV